MVYWTEFRTSLNQSAQRFYWIACLVKSCTLNPAYTPTLWQRFHNIGANAVSMSVPTLWRYSFVDTIKHPSNVVWMSRQCCVNIIPTLYFDQNPNIATMLSQCWLMLANFETTFRQHCVNVVAMLLSLLGTNIETTFGQRLHNIDWMLS